MWRLKTCSSKDINETRRFHYCIFNMLKLLACFNLTLLNALWLGQVLHLPHPWYAFANSGYIFFLCCFVKGLALNLRSSFCQVSVVCIFSVTEITLYIRNVTESVLSSHLQIMEGLLALFLQNVKCILNSTGWWNIYCYRVLLRMYILFL